MTSREFHEKLQRRARKVGLVVARPTADALERYYRLLALWNERINLTALPLAEAGDDAVDRLLIEPLIAARYLPSATAAVLDIGSGGGSPAIPMKIAAPGIRMRMVESKTRKSAFLREAVRHLDLADTSVETARYEELLTRPDLHEASDVVTLRAVRVEVRVLMGLQAFLHGGGLLFLFRSRSGPAVPAGLTPPLVWDATHPIGDSFSSRLVILRKALLGAIPPGPVV
jgi:16S rRNA (guanine527-N7)-methyltransferase